MQPVLELKLPQIKDNHGEYLLYLTTPTLFTARCSTEIPDHHSPISSSSSQYMIYKKQSTPFIKTQSNYLSNYKGKSRAPHAVPTLVFQGPSFYLKCVVKRGITQKYSFQSYDPCLSNAHCHYEQVLHVWCCYLLYFLINGIHLSFYTKTTTKMMITITIARIFLQNR